MITIGYGGGLPTGFAANTMWEFHTTSLAQQLVVSLKFPLTEGGIDAVYDTVHQLLYETDFISPLPPIDSIQGMSLDLRELSRLAKRFYNSGVNQCAKKATTLEESKTILGVSKQGLKTLSGIAQELESAQPWVVGENEDDGSSVSTLVSDLFAKIDDLLTKAADGKLVSRLTDAQMQEVLSFGSMKGQLLARSAAIGSRGVVGVQAPIESLGKFLGLYDTNTMPEIDNEATDGFIGLGLLFTEAKRDFPSTKQTMASIADIAKSLALPGKNGGQAHAAHYADSYVADPRWGSRALLPYAPLRRDTSGRVGAINLWPPQHIAQNKSPRLQQLLCGDWVQQRGRQHHAANDQLKRAQLFALQIRTTDRHPTPRAKSRAPVARRTRCHPRGRGLLPI